MSWKPEEHMVETSGGLDICPHEEWLEQGACHTCVRCGYREFYECMVHDWSYDKSRYRQCRRCGTMEDTKS
jgi:hypothetical protein